MSIFEKNIKYYLGCRPTIHPIDGSNVLPAIEETNCKKEKCPLCTKEMWVGDETRKCEKDNSNIRLICLMCCKTRSDLSGKEPMVVDIDKIE